LELEVEASDLGCAAMWSPSGDYIIAREAKAGKAPAIASASRVFSGSGYLSSKRSMAPAMVVVQRPFLSPTADWVTLAVRTILLEMR
jgi:hypothetical protein